MVGERKLVGLDGRAVGTPRFDEPVRGAVVEARFGRVGDDHCRARFGSVGARGPHQQVADLEERRVRVGRESRVTVGRAQLVLQLPVPPHVEVGQLGGEAAHRIHDRPRNRFQPEHRRDQRGAVDAFARLRQVAGENRPEGEPGDRHSFAQPLADVGCAIGERDQMLCAQLGDRSVQPVGVAVTRIARDEDVPASLVEELAQRIHLLRTVGKPVEEDQRALDAVSLRVEARVAERVDVGPVEVLDAGGNVQRFCVVMQGLLQWILH